MALPVEIYIQSDASSPAPIADVAVSVHDPVSKAVVSTGTTDGLGSADLLLPEGTYHVRCYKAGVLFPRPGLIAVVDEEDNSFGIIGHVVELPVSTDPRCCRCTGRFVDGMNRPLAHATVRISTLAESGYQTPKMVDGSMVAGDALSLKTDDNGRVSLDLIRGGEYYITYIGEDETAWKITVPDRPACNLIDLIHPSPKSVTWDDTVAPDGTVNLRVGESIRVPVSVLFSDFQTITRGLNQWLQASPTVNSPTISVALEDDEDGSGLVVSSTEACSFQVRLSVVHLLPSMLPTPALLQGPLTVVVSE